MHRLNLKKPQISEKEQKKENERQEASIIKDDEDWCIVDLTHDKGEGPEGDEVKVKMDESWGRAIGVKGANDSELDDEILGKDVNYLAENLFNKPGGKPK